MDEKGVYKLRYIKLSEKNYKYQNVELFRINIGQFIKLKIKLVHTFFTFDTDGWLEIFPGYCWDGCSGPTIDTQDNMVGCLVHDVLAQCCRLGWLDTKEVFDIINRVLQFVCTQDGITKVKREHKNKIISGLLCILVKFRYWYYYKGVSLYKNWAKPNEHSEPTVYEAP